MLDDSEHPWPEGQYNDLYMDESVFDNRDDILSIADQRNLVSNAAVVFVIIPQSPQVVVLDEGNTTEDTGFDQGYKAVSIASWDVVVLYDSENLDRQLEVQYQPIDAEDELTESYETRSIGSTSVTSVADQDTVTLCDSTDAEDEPTESYETRSIGSTSVTSIAGQDVIILYNSEDLDRQLEDRYYLTDAKDELTKSYETRSIRSTSVISVASWDVITLYDSEDLDYQLED